MGATGLEHRTMPDGLYRGRRSRRTQQSWRAVDAEPACSPGNLPARRRHGGPLGGPDRHSDQGVRQSWVRGGPSLHTAEVGVRVAQRPPQNTCSRGTSGFSVERRDPGVTSTRPKGSRKSRVEGAISQRIGALDAASRRDHARFLRGPVRHRSTLGFSDWLSFFHSASLSLERPQANFGCNGMSG
jgi:hypothetical protein